MEQKIAPNAKLYLTKGIVLFWGTIIDTEIHQHHACQLTLGVEHDFLLQTAARQVSTRALLLDAECKHQLFGKAGLQVLILVEPESIYGKYFKEYLAQCDYSLLPSQGAFLERVKTYLSAGEVSLALILQDFLTGLGLAINEAVLTDERVSQALRLMENLVEKRVKIIDLANQVGLSESRLQHLFKDQVGISMKRYLLWQKMLSAFALITQGKEMTFAAYEAGFADSAHLSRTFKEMFGLKLSDLFLKSSSIQVMICKN